jgi:hypothetical protein
MDATHKRFPTQVSWKKGPIVAQLVTHIPDCVVHLDHSKKLPHFDQFDGVVFFADVSGRMPMALYGSSMIHSL